MTNPTILNLMSSLFNGNTSVNGQSLGDVKILESGKGDRHFLSDMLKALHASENGAVHMSDRPTITNTTLKHKGYKYYLESLKKELLAHGKPMNKAILNEDDLPLIKIFLLQCGFSHEKVDRFIKDLTANGSNGEVNMSQVFLKLTELETSEAKDRMNETFGPSTVPYIESVLRDFNLMPNELDYVFCQARVQGGGLDIRKLTAKLKEIGGRSHFSNETIGDQNLSRQISEKMEIIGLATPKNGKADHISLDDFITSLENITGKDGKEKKVSSDIKNTIAKILERVEHPEQKAAPASSAKVSSKYDFTGSLLKEAIDKKAHHAFNEKVISTSNKSKPGKNEFISSSLNQKDAKTMNHAKAHMVTSNQTGKTDLLSDLNKKIELVNPVEEKNSRIETEAGKINVPRNSEAVNLTNSLKTVEHGEKFFRGYLPASIVDQVGKQISRSILRGDQVVTLQLKPPDLGTVRITMEIKDHTLKLGMTAEHHSIRELMLNNVHELKDALVQHGIKLEKVDIQIHYNFGQSLNASKEGMNNREGWRKNFNGEQIHSGDHTEGLPERPMNIMAGSNLVDLMA